MDKREFKDNVYKELAKITKAIANPHRMEIIDLLAQGPFSVEQIAIYTGMSIANASQHLQTLKNAKLVKIAREGNFIHYSLSGKNVFNAWMSLRELGFAYNTEVEKILQDFRSGHNSATDAIDIETLKELLKKDEILLLDVRPKEEFDRGHIWKALSVPIEDLQLYLKKIPQHKMIVAYCRGPFCVYADEAVKILKKEGFNAKRMDEGFPEWQSKSFPIEK